MKAKKNLKKILSLILILFTFVACFDTSLYVKAAKNKSNTYKAGDDITLGRLDGAVLSWTILNYDDTTKTALVVARKPISSYSIGTYKKAIQNTYLSTKTTAGYVRWSENYWRGWLNESFYATSFTDDERAKIQKTTLTSEAAQQSLLNFYHDTTNDAYYIQNKKKNSLYSDIYDSQTTTTDYIFFLSSDEYVSYKANMKFETSLTWPLRTNAYDDPNQSLFVNDSTKLVERGYYYGGGGIRPAMYLKLGETTDTADASTSSSSASTSTSNDSSSSSTTSTSSSSATASSSTTSSTKSATSSSTSTKTATTKSYANNATNVGNIRLPDDSSHSLNVGSTGQVAINMEYLNSTDKDYTVTYKSSNASVFTVDSSGKVTATGMGTASLTVRMKKSNGKVYTMSCRIDVV